MAYEKLFNEIYAVTLLKYFWNDYQQGFVKGESPDWYNLQMNLGIEVSQALSPRDGQDESFLEQYLGRRKEDIPAAAFEKYGSRLYFYNQRLWAILDDTAAIGYEEKIITRFRCKLEKLNTNYHRFHRNALYLYAHAELSQKEAAAIMAKLTAANNKTYPFHAVFLDCTKVVYIFDFEKQKIKPIPIPEKALTFLNEKTEELRFTDTWENGTRYL